MSEASIVLPQFGPTEWTILWVVLVSSFIALGYGLLLAFRVLREDPGSPAMVRVAAAIEEGAFAYLARQVKTMIWFVIAITIGLFFMYRGMYEGLVLPLGVSLAFLMGVAASYGAGYVGMWLAVKGNVRTAAAALKILIGFGFGGSLAALFMRMGGGIFTKAADVGADLVGKIEKGIPEDDPRNPATIAGNVGDNVGDCAGMAADVFESYALTIVAAMILGGALFGLPGVVFPLLARSGAILTSILGTFFVKAKNDRENPIKPLIRGFAISAVSAIVIFMLLAVFLLG